MAACTIYNRTSTTHRSQLENGKYRNWVKAGLGLHYVKEGLEVFCDDIVNQMHVRILQKVRLQHPLAGCQCNLKTLLPAHASQKRNMQCLLGQPHCNCLYRAGKHPCPIKVCDEIYDEIILLHASKPPVPNWKNTDISRWCNDPWAIATCFLKLPGYNQRRNASEMDITGLLNLIIHNKMFHNHIMCNINGTDVFSKVREIRNIIMHNNSMELEDAETLSFLDDMIALLQDQKELINRRESQEAVKKLKQLKKEDFIISATREADVVRDVMLAITLKEKELKETINDAHFQMDLKTAEFRSEVEARLKDLDEKLKERIPVPTDSGVRSMAVRNDGVDTTNDGVDTTNDGADTTNDGADTSNSIVGIDNRSINTANVNIRSESRSCVLFQNSRMENCQFNITIHNTNQ